MVKKIIPTKNQPEIVPIKNTVAHLHDKRATVFFTPIAWAKILSLVMQYGGEVQWHGLVKRLSENSFVVENILNFPHEATEGSVISDQKEYEDWLNNIDDETFKKIRLHGHSHVNMLVRPSPIDTRYRSDIVRNFGKPHPSNDVFYIFFIINKRGDVSGEIVDSTNEAVYITDHEKNEIDFVVKLTETETIKQFMDNAKSVVTVGKFKGFENFENVTDYNVVTNNGGAIYEPN